MILTSENLAAHAIKSAGDTITTTAGQVVRVKAGGSTQLNEACPAGKTWEVHINIYIVETDA